MAHSKLTRSEAKSRLDKWTHKASNGIDYLLQPGVDEFPEEIIKDKAKAVLTGKITLKKKKPWLLEYQWHSKLKFTEYRDKIGRYFAGSYSPEWQPGIWKSRYETPTAATSSFKSLKKSKYTDPAGRNWRIRNEYTGEIINLPI